MTGTYTDLVVSLVLENSSRELGRLAARQPVKLAGAWSDILLALAAADGVDAEALLEALEPVLRGGRPRRSLDDALDADANRAVHWAALYGHAARLDAFKSHGADLRPPNRLGTTPLFD